MVESTPPSLSSSTGRLIQPSQEIHDKRFRVPPESRTQDKFQTEMKKHYNTFSCFLSHYLEKSSPKEGFTPVPPDARSRSRQRFARLTSQQFYELSADVYDELVRRRDKIESPSLPIREDFHPKRNVARQKLATLSTSRFQDLSSDVYIDLLRRYPELQEDDEVTAKEKQQKMLLNKSREEVMTYLNIIFNEVKHYRKLLSLGEDESQKVLDAFQLLLDTGNYHNRTQMIAAVRRLSERTDRYPARFFLKGPGPATQDDPVASGSFADIYKVAWQGKEICYKVLRVSQRSLAEHITKVYAREAILWGQLSHPNILPFYGLSKFQSRPALVSRWAMHGSVDEYLIENPDVNRVLLCSDTAAGVEYLHQSDIVHGDLKGVNVLVNDFGRACLGDFGLSSVTDPQIIKWVSQSTMASKGGTTRWQAPELLHSEDKVEKVYNSKESDVYAWANIFTGCHPFFEVLRDSSVIVLIMRGVTPTRPARNDPAWLKHGLNDRIWNLMMDCWKFQPSERPNMTTVMSELAAEKSGDCRPPGKWEEKGTVHFQDIQDINSLSDSCRVWEELNTLLSRVIKDL